MSILDVQPHRKSRLRADTRPARSRARRISAFTDVNTNSARGRQDPAPMSSHDMSAAAPPATDVLAEQNLTT